MSKKRKASKNQRVINKEEKIMNNTENKEGVTVNTPIEQPIEKTEEIIEGQMSLNLDPSEETGNVDVTPGDAPELPETEPINVDPVNNESENKDEVDNSEEDELPGVVSGKLDNCAQLYVRSEPSKEGEVLTVINDKDTLIITEAESTEDFYKVEVNGVIGFCMKKFIKID